MRVRDVMDRSMVGLCVSRATIGDDLVADGVVAHPEQPVSELVTVMRLAGLRAVPVVEHGDIVGMVGYRDLIRGLARDDTTIAHDIARRLNAQRGIGRWAVAVRDGAAALVGDACGDVERHCVRQMAESVTGVVCVRFRDEQVLAPAPRRADSLSGRTNPW